MAGENITLDHGGGGRLSHQLITEHFVTAFNNAPLNALNDSAVLDVHSSRIALSTDSYTVDPIFFPGGDIGSLALHGTINDVAMSGARPLFITVGIILEEGFPFDDLKRIISSMSRAAREAGVTIVTGDTKVVPRGKADKIFINTTGLGLIERDITLGGELAVPGDSIIISGTIGDHGACIMAAREGLITISSPVKSDSAPLHQLLNNVLDAVDGVHVLRDPTRGGVAATLNEIALQSNVGIEIDEGSLPYRDSVTGLCEILGLDPLYLANEGKVLIFVKGPQSQAALESIRTNSLGSEAKIIGRVVEDHPRKVILKTSLGGKRILDMPAGEQLPRIC